MFIILTIEPNVISDDDIRRSQTDLRRGTMDGEIDVREVVKLFTEQRSEGGEPIMISKGRGADAMISEGV